jgi:hypothetical protein
VLDRVMDLKKMNRAKSITVNGATSNLQSAIAE